MHSTLLALLAVAAPLAFAQDRTTEAGEAAIKDPAAECTYYAYSDVTNNIANFPTIWSPASIISGDSEANDKWNSISSSVPDIAPKVRLQAILTCMR